VPVCLVFLCGSRAAICGVPGATPPTLFTAQKMSVDEVLTRVTNSLGDLRATIRFMRRYRLWN